MLVRSRPKIARPGDIQFTDALPKTRSGKIIRRFLRNLASGEEVVGDATTEAHGVGKRKMKIKRLLD